MAYKLNTPWEWQTWGAGNPWPDKYSRIAGRPITGGTYTGTTNPFITDVPRGVTLIINGSTVTATLYPYQDDLSNADSYYLGGHAYTISDSQAAILTAAGYGSYLTPVV
jgi:hypothetical protein